MPPPISGAPPTWLTRSSVRTVVRLSRPTPHVAPHAGRGLAGKAPLEKPARAPSKRRPALIFWTISLICTFIGGAIGLLGVLGANGAPQEAAAAAVGCLIVIAPYAFARAVDELIRD